MEFNFQSKKAALLAVQTDYKSKVQTEVQLHLDDFNGKFSKQPEVQLIRDLSQLDNPTDIEKQLYREGIKAILTVPLYSRNELVGLLNLGAREKEAFTQQTITAIQELSALLTISIGPIDSRTFMAAARPSSSMPKLIMAASIASIARLYLPC